MEFWDTHFHIKEGTDVASLITEARENHVKHLFIIGATQQDSIEALEIANNYGDDIYAVVGIHPHHCNEFNNDIQPFIELLKSPKAIAVGEVGLDYYYDFAKPEEQIPVFEQFINLAKEQKKPMVIHCREAFKDCIPILKNNLPNKFEIHSFTGNKEELFAVLDLGAYISFNGIITFPSAENVRDLLRMVPLDRLLIETDSPFLTPHPYRKYQNSPKFIPIIAQKIADVKNVTLDKLVEITGQNSRDLFNIK